MQPLELAGLILIGWCTLSVVVAAGWSRFMSDVHRRERKVVLPRRMLRRTHDQAARAA
jgi:hypothetical protein